MSGPTPPPLPSPKASTASSETEPQARWRKLFPALLAAGIGAMVGWFFADDVSSALSSGGSLAGAVLLGVGALVGLLLVIAFHEVGHVIAGRLVGFRLQHVSVGPLVMRRAPDGWQASLRRTHFFGGMAHSVPGPAAVREDLPPNEVWKALRWRRAVRLLGGAAGNAVTGAAALALGSALPEGAGAAALHFFGVVSLFVGAFNLLPMRTGGMMTDGAHLWPLLTHDSASARRAMALAALRAEAYGGTRPRAWSTRWIEGVLDTRDKGVNDGSALMLAYRHALDAGRTGVAHGHLAEALGLMDRLPALQHKGLMNEAAYFEAAYRGDAERARAWLRRADSASGHVPACAAGRAEAAALLAEERREEAHRRLENAQAALDRHPVPGTAAAEHAWLHALAQAARPAAAATTAPSAPTT